MQYNGYRNYETWCVNLWLNNEEHSYNYWREQAAAHKAAAPDCSQVADGIWTQAEAARFNLADTLKEEITDAAPTDDATMWADLLRAALSEVDWAEIADRFLED